MPSLEWIKHAFAVEAAESVDPTDAQRAVVDRLCRELDRRQLATPATVFLEMSRPLGFLAAQTIHFLTPIISAITDAQGHRHFAEFLEHPGAVDYLLERIAEVGRDESASPRGRRDTEGAQSGR